MERTRFHPRFIHQADITDSVSMRSTWFCSNRPGIERLYSECVIIKRGTCLNRTAREVAPLVSALEAATRPNARELGRDRLHGAVSRHAFAPSLLDAWLAPAARSCGYHHAQVVMSKSCRRCAGRPRARATAANNRARRDRSGEELDVFPRFPLRLTMIGLQAHGFSRGASLR